MKTGTLFIRYEEVDPNTYQIVAAEMAVSNLELDQVMMSTSEFLQMLYAQVRRNVQAMIAVSNRDAEARRKQMEKHVALDKKDLPSGSGSA